jgi:hypothetical protein
MPIIFACTCGKQLQMAEAWAGKVVRCPICSGVVTVPAPAPAAIPVAVPAAVPASAPPQTNAVASQPPILPAPPAHNEFPSAGVRSWLYPPKTGNFLLAITSDVLWTYSKIFVSVRPEHEKLESTGDPFKALGEKAQRIPLDSLQKIALDKRRANLIVYYQEKNKRNKQVNKSREFFIDDEKKRDEIVACLKERLGAGCTERTEQPTPLSAIGGHLILIVLTLAAVPLLLLLIHWLQGPNLLEGMQGRFWFRIGQALIHGAQAVFRWLGMALDILTLVVAGILLVIWIILVISQVRKPPLMVYLERQADEKR